MRGALMLFALAACGRVGFESSPDATAAIVAPGVVDGTRVKAWYWEADGAREFGGWTDTLLGVDCYFVDVGDGQRCLPVGIDRGHVMSQAYPMFSDASCTVPSLGGYDPVEANTCLPPPTMYTHSGRVWTVGPKIPALPYLGAAGSCTPFNGLQQWQLTNPMDYTAFVHATATKLALGDIVLTQTMAEDGAQVAGTRPIELASGEQCTPQQRPDGSVRCALGDRLDHASRDLSINSVPSKIFADAACTTPAALAGSTDTPAYVTDVVQVPCGDSIVDEYEIGAEVPAGFAQYEGMCMPQTGWRFYLLGAKRPARRVLQGTWERGAGGTRLHATTITIGGVKLPGEVWDDGAEASCDRQQDSAGTWRCFPGYTNASIVTVHRKPDCTDTDFTAYSMCGAAPVIQGGVFVTPMPGCQAFGRRALTTTATSGLYRATTGGCQAISGSLYAPDGGERAPTDFVEAVYRPAGT